MREIKFRIWDKELKRYDSPNVHHLLKNDGIVSIVLNMDVQKISGNDRFIIQQFTGLKDKNGKEIYEGDIVHRFGHCSLMNVPSIDEHKEIKWWSEGGRWNYTPCLDCSLEVVGNIFENPELLR